MESTHLKMAEVGKHCLRLLLVKFDLPFGKKSIKGFQTWTKVVIVFSLIKQAGFPISANSVLFVKRSSIVGISELFVPLCI